MERSRSKCRILAAVFVAFLPAAYAQAACTVVSPTVTLDLPNQTATQAGQVFTYNINVKNNDSAECSAATYALDTTVTSGINVYFPVKTLTVTPGQTGHFDVLVGSAPTALDGTYQMNINVANSASAQGTGTAQGSYILKTVIAACQHANPTVRFTTANQIATPGHGVLYYTAMVTNNDSKECAAATFQLTPVVQSGLSPYLGSSSLSLAPGETDMAILVVGSAPWITEGVSYSVAMTATNSDSNNIGTTPSGSYLLNNSPNTVCSHLNPTVNFSKPKQRASAAGQVLNYVVSINNNDTPGCAATTFKISTALTPGLGANFATKYLALKPGRSAQALIQVGSAPTASDASYSVSAILTSTTTPDQTGTAEGTYILNTKTPAPDLQALEKPYALELLSLLNPTTAEYASAKASIDQQDYVQTLKNFRNSVINRLRSVDMGQFGPGEANFNPDNILAAQMLVGRFSTTQYNLGHAQQYFFTDYFGMRGDPYTEQAPITWFPAGAPNGDASAQYCDFGVFKQLPAAYLMTSDPIYLQKWFQIFGDFSQNQLNSYKQLSADWQSKVVCNPHNSLGTVARINSTIHTLGAFAKALPSTTAPSDWLHALTPRTTALSADSLDIIPELPFYLMMKSWALDYASWLMQIFVPPRGNPASREYALTYLGLLFNVTAPFQQTAINYPIFLGSSNDIDGLGNGGMLGDLSSTYYPNEAMLERSFNYMLGLATTDRFFLRIYQPNPPDWVKLFSNNLNAAQKFFAATLTPFQQYPRVGAYVEQVAPAVWQTPSTWAEWLQTGLQKDIAAESIRVCKKTYLDCWGAENSMPAFTSIGFPYSGYNIFRKNWGNQSPYLYFSTGPSSNGHQVADLNSLQLIAYGRPMLVSAGPSYGYAGEPQGMSDYLSDYNTAKTNTIIVNNEPQFRFSVPGNYDSEYESANQGILPARWITTSNYDFAEGVEAWGYGPSGGYQVTNLDYNHQRQVIFVRELELWVVVDQMIANRNGISGNFSQFWHFSPFAPASKIPGYTAEQVVVNADDKSIITQDPTTQTGLAGPNLSIYQFGLPSLNYASHYGDTTAVLPGSTTPIYAGWYSASYAGPVYPSPEVWVNWTGAGHQQLVSLLIPNPPATLYPEIDKSLRTTPLQVSEKTDLSQGSITGFKLKQTNGSVLTYLSSLQANQLVVTLPSPLPSISIEGVVKTVTGSPVLILNNNYGPAPSFLQGPSLLVNYNTAVSPARISGIVLGAQSMTINGVKQVVSGDFVFDLVPTSTNKYALRKLADIKIPTTFQWTATTAGLIPKWN